MLSSVPSGAGKVEVVVRNTFIDAAIPEDEDEDGSLSYSDRTQSDQTGLRVKRFLPLSRLPSRPQPITEEGASVMAEQAAVGDAEEGEGCDGEEEEEEEDDDDDDAPLARTQRVVYPAHASAADLGTPTSSYGNLPEEVAASMLSAGIAASSSSSGPSAQAMAAYGGFMAGMPWGWSCPYGMYGMYDSNGMFPAYAAGGMGQFTEGQEKSASSAWEPPPLPPLSKGPPMGMLHSFHQETRDMGIVTPDFRQFSKVGFEGRLSVVSEKEVHTEGVQRYLVQFTSGDLSRADGVGFVFSPRLPCAKNIQRIVSIFVNQRGRICMRVFADIVRASTYMKPLELGDWVEMAIDLEEKVATFHIWPSAPTGWPATSGQPTSTAVFPYGQRLARLGQDGGGKKKGAAAQAVNSKAVKLNAGHLACVVKNIGVTVTLAS